MSPEREPWFSARDRPWKCRIFGHKFENWAGRFPGYCLRCGMRPETATCQPRDET